LTRDDGAPDDWGGSDLAALAALYAWLQSDRQGRTALHQLLANPDTGAPALIGRLHDASRDSEAPGEIANYLSGGRVDKLVQIAKNYGPVVLQFTSASERQKDHESVNLLPRDISDFTGRSDDIAHVLKVLGDAEKARMSSPIILSISGAPGVGKSALAVHIANSLAARFPDAQLYARLQDDGGRPLDQGEILADLLEAVGVDRIPTSTEGRAAKYRSVLARRSCLIVLDDVRDEDQVQKLLPGGPTCAVLITSRSELTTLEGVSSLPLKVMEENDAAELLQRIIGDDRLSNQPKAARDIARFCDHLPLLCELLVPSSGRIGE